jgi:hypothetical protein
MKRLVHCSDNGVDKYLYHKCETGDESSINTVPVHHHATHVIIFQMLMAVFGGLAYWGVQIRRKKSMSQFDTRRQHRYVPLQTI